MLTTGPFISPLLVGRDELLELAERRIDEVASGRGQTILVAGEAGIGKSRLSGAIARMAMARGLRRAGGDLAPQDRDVPAAALLDLARSMARDAAFGDLGRALLSLADETIATPGPQRRVLVLRAVDLIADAATAPTMLTFDDLQWADDVSLEIVAELARRIVDRPVLLVGLYRSDEVAPGSILRPWRSRLLTQRVAEEIRLSRLTAEQTGLMTTLIIGSGLPAPRDVVRAVYERTDGVPLHVEELLGAIGTDTATNGWTIREAAVPQTLEDATLQRVARLSPEAQSVARAGAVIGRCFVADVLAGIMDTSEESLDAPIQELIDSNVLDWWATARLYDFRHQLLRDTLYRSLSEGERRRLHARVAEFGATLEGASEIHASVHYERAGLSAQAFRTALAGARSAARLSSHREAFDLYRRALANLPPDLATRERAELFEAAAREAAAVEENALAERLASEAREVYMAAGDKAAAVSMHALVGSLRRRDAQPLSRRLELAAAALGEAEVLPEGDDRESATLDAMFELAINQVYARDAAGARDSIARLRILVEARDDDRGDAEARWLTSVADAVLGDPRDGLDRLADVAARAGASGWEELCVTAYRDASTIAARTMDYRRARTWLSEGRRYADTYEQSHCGHVMTAVDALVAWAEGRWIDAVATGEQAIADGGCARGITIARTALGYVLLGRGAGDRAKTHLDEALEIARRSEEIDLLLPVMWGLAELSLVGGDAPAAVRWCETAAELAATQGERILLAPFTVTGTRAYQASGRPDEAERWLERLATQLGDTPAAVPGLDHAAGLVRLATGSTNAARDALERAVAGWSQCGRTWETTWARLDLASCLLRSNRHSEALTVLGTARAAAAGLDSEPLLARADELMRVARGRGITEEPWRPLTVREYEVARLIGEGMTNAAIARELEISPKTASAHVEHILAKLGATRRTEIATWVAAIGGRFDGAVRTPQRDRDTSAARVAVRAARMAATVATGTDSRARRRG